MCPKSTLTGMWEDHPYQWAEEPDALTGDIQDP